MNLYLLIRSTDFSGGDGYYQDHVLGIYEDSDVAHQVMHELTQEHENEEPACQADILTSFFVKHMTLIPKVSAKGK